MADFRASPFAANGALQVPGVNLPTPNMVNGYDTNMANFGQSDTWKSGYEAKVQKYGGVPDPTTVLPKSNIGGAPGASSNNGIFSQNSMFGSSNTDVNGVKTTTGGWVSPALSAVGTGVNAYLGFKGLGLAEDTLDFQKESWEKNFAMMQDQYYRKLNDRRAYKHNLGRDQTRDEVNAVRDHYDSGTNIEGAYNPSSASASGFAPTRENARTMNLAQSGAPLSAQGAYDATHNPNTKLLPGSRSAFVNPNATPTPVTSADASVSNTSIGPRGQVKKRRRKKNPAQSDSNSSEKRTETP